MSEIIDPDLESAYQKALDLLYSTINFEEKPVDRYHASKLDTSRTSRLLQLMGNPHLSYPAVHIAGTKGKGSVAAMSAAVLRAAGVRVGLFTSPHLRDVRERVRVLTRKDSQGWIPKADFVHLINRLGDHFGSLEGVTWFEMMTAIGFQHFADQEVDIAVVEVGLGGRLDTTNVLTPLVSVITSLSLDHTYLLGDSLAQIAFEKGGIIKQGVPVVVAPQKEEALQVLRSIAKKQEAKMTLVGRDWQYQGASHQLIITHAPASSFVPVETQFDVALAGDHQLENAAVALATMDVIKGDIPDITFAAAQHGIAEVQWEGRLQTLYSAENGPTLLIDSAHNKDSAAKLATALIKDYSFEDLWFIFGAPQDKAISQMMVELFPLAKGIIVAAADHPRAASPTHLAQLAREQGFSAIPVSSPEQALRAAFAHAANGDLICACGSIIFVGDLLNQWERLQSELTAK